VGPAILQNANLNDAIMTRADLSGAVVLARSSAARPHFAGGGYRSLDLLQIL